MKMASFTLLRAGLLCWAALAIIATNALDTQVVMVAPPTSSLLIAGLAIEALQTWYNQTTGLWEGTAWWNSANAMVLRKGQYSSFHVLINTSDCVRGLLCHCFIQLQ